MKQTTWDGMQLRQWRLDQDLTVSQLAEAIHISEKRLYSIENGYPPTLEQAHKITRLTRGAIRYRDIYIEFDPRYA